MLYSNLEEDWDPTCEHGDEVDEEERASAVLVAEVGEPPHVAQPHADRDAGEEEVQLVAPPSPLVLLVVAVKGHNALTGSRSPRSELTFVALGRRLHDPDV